MYKYVPRGGGGRGPSRGAGDLDEDWDEVIGSTDGEEVVDAGALDDVAIGQILRISDRPKASGEQ